MAEIDTGYNLALETVKLHDKYDEHAERKIEKLIQGIEALNIKLEKFVDLRQHLLEASKGAPESVEYSREEDPEICDLIDFFNEETDKEVDHDKNHRLDLKDLQIMEQRLQHLCGKFERQSNLEQNKLHPLMLDALTWLQVATSSLRNHHESNAAIVRQQK